MYQKNLKKKRKKELEVLSKSFLTLNPGWSQEDAHYIPKEKKEAINVVFHKIQSTLTPNPQSILIPYVTKSLASRK